MLEMSNASTTLTLLTVQTISILNTIWIIMAKMWMKQSLTPFAILWNPLKLQCPTMLHMIVSIILSAIGMLLIAILNIRSVRIALFLTLENLVIAFSIQFV